MTPSADDLRFMADTLPQLAWMADSGGDIVWYNRRWYDYTGTTPEQMRDHGWRMVHDPERVEAVAAGLTAAFAKAEPWEDTFPLRGADGRYRWFLSRATPMLDADGAVVRWFGTNTDITDQRSQAGALARSERRFRSLIDASAAIIWTTPANGAFGGDQRRWNRFTGQTPEQAQGWGWLDAIHPEDRAAAADAWTTAVERRGLYEVEYRLQRHDGVWRWMSVHAAPVLDDDGSVAEWVGLHSDIDDRKQAEAELAAARDAAESANQAKSRFIANMSHELRTPLSAVIGYSEMLEEEVEEIGETRLLDDLKKINANARHLLSLISDVLDISKIEANRMTVYAEDIDVAALVSGVASTVDSLIRKRGNRLVVEAADDLGQMHQDQVKLRQCLFNLIGNAGKFTEAGTITLSARRMRDDSDMDWLCFSVRDTGIGMTPEQLDRLFQRFTQADESTTRRFGGTGLGLAITKSFVEMLGGSIDVTSQEGQGSTFTIRVPARYAEPEPVESGDQSHEVVLVVDDDPASRDLLSRFLNREGFQVRTAGDGRSGLTLARSLKPRVILLDVMMPQMDGWSVLSAIKADPELVDTPVVMISFVNEPSLATALGASGYLIKPVEWDQLKHVMDRYRQEGTNGVLVIDDDADTRDRMHDMLTRRGLPVAVAENGRQGLEAVALAMPSLILLDLTMPEMDGFDFLEALRAKPEWRDIPVIVMTAKHIGADDQKRLDGKVDQVISKGSLDLRMLADQLRDYVAPPAVNHPGSPA